MSDQPLPSDRITSSGQASPDTRALPAPAGQVAKPASGRGAGATRKQASQRWTLSPGDAETMVAEARKALFVMAGILAVLWIIQIINVADSYRLTYDYGIRAHDLTTLPYIFTAPFLHFSWTHIEGNSGPLFIFGFLAAYRGVMKFLGVTLLVIVTSGLAAWIFAAPNTVGAGASGVVFGYLGYILVRGLFDRHAIDLLVAAIMALCFAYQFTVLLPHAGIGWQAHIGGLVGGVLAGWVFRERATAGATKTTRAPRLRKGRGANPAGRVAGTGSYTGPRADLHKQLDDLGL
jgi:membrane associated rhomboid family serine protease